MLTAVRNAPRRSPQPTKPLPTPNNEEVKETISLIYSEAGRLNHIKYSGPRELGKESYNQKPTDEINREKINEIQAHALPKMSTSWFRLFCMVPCYICDGTISD